MVDPSGADAAALGGGGGRGGGFFRGERVELVDLQSRPELNGRTALVAEDCTPGRTPGESAAIIPVLSHTFCPAGAARRELEPRLPASRSEISNSYLPLSHPRRDPFFPCPGRDQERIPVQLLTPTGGAFQLPGAMLSIRPDNLRRETLFPADPARETEAVVAAMEEALRDAVGADLVQEVRQRLSCIRCCEPYEGKCKVPHPPHLQVRGAVLCLPP